ncbi:MAG: spermidine synthase [Actinobacteria bacterium]|nr:spermidine synthase [Actinomycetota bacterium]
MPPPIEELAWAETPMGVISLRRRWEASRQVDVYEVKLDDEFLMSSLFTVAEEALAHLTLQAVSGTDLDVVVGGLGLGYTARAVLEDDRVRSLTVIEALAEVIAWHDRGLLPDAQVLTSDPRVRVVHGDFFTMVDDDRLLGADGPAPLVDAVLLDIDHTPRNVLAPSHAGFYTVAGLKRLTRHLRPGGAFGLWSDDPPDEDFERRLTAAFADVEAHVVRFPNFYTASESASTVYVARR